MAAKQQNSIVPELIREIESYLPEMSALLHTLSRESDSNRENVLRKLHSMIHTIKGTAAMIQLRELSKTAALMEDALDRILAGTQNHDVQFLEIMENTVDRIASYCSCLQNGDKTDGAQLYTITEDALNRLDSSRPGNPITDDSQIAKDHAADDDELESFLNTTDSDSDLAEVHHNSATEDNDLVAFIATDEEDDKSEEDKDESMDDFFQQFGDEGDDTKLDDELEMLLNSTDNSTESSGLDFLLSDSEPELEPVLEHTLTIEPEPELQPKLTIEPKPEPEPKPEQIPAHKDLSQVAEMKATPAVPAEAAFDIDPELQECFNEEVIEHLENLALQLNSLSSSITAPTAITEEQRETLHSIRRSVHTMKGAAAVIGIEPVAAWGHTFEDFLDWLHDESPQLSPEIVSIMFDGSDLLEKLADTPGVNVDNEINTIQKHFQTIIDESNTIQEAPSQSSDTQPSAIQQELQESLDDILDDPAFDNDDDLEMLLDSTDDSPDTSELDSLLSDSEPEVEPEPAQFADFEDFSEDLSQIAEINTVPDEPVFDIDPELQECFNEEVVEHLENLALQLNSLSSSITAPTAITEEQRETLHSIRRSVHTMKGAAAVIGIEPVAAWGHTFEDFLDWLHDESPQLSPEIVSVMFDGSDLLEKLADAPGVNVDNEINTIQKHFQTIIDESHPIQEAPSQSSDTQPSAIQQELQESLDDILDDPAFDNDDDLEMLPDSTDDSPDTSELDSLLSDSEPEVEPEPAQFADFENFSEDLSQIAEINTVPDEPVFDIDPELQECFNEEVVEHLENLALQLNSLSSFITAPTAITEEQRETLHSIRRSVHTMKGAAAVIGIEPVAAWGHTFEDFLDWLHDESPQLSPEIVSIMFDGSDLLEKLANAPGVNVDNEINTIQKHFKTIIDESNTIQEAPSQSSDTQPSAIQQELQESLDDILDDPAFDNDDDLEMLPDSTDDSPDTSELDSLLSDSEPEGEPEPAQFADFGNFSEDLSQIAEINTVPDEPVFDIDPELQECFNEEVVEHLENLALQLNSLSSSITAPTVITEEQRETLHSIRRSVHTMKGAAAVIGIEPVAAWGHTFEDFLDWLHDESPQLSPEIVSIMFDGSDLLEKLADTPGVNVDNEINTIQKHFQTIIDESHPIQEAPSHPSDIQTASIQPELQESLDEILDDPAFANDDDLAMLLDSTDDSPDTSELDSLLSDSEPEIEPEPEPEQASAPEDLNQVAEINDIPDDPAFDNDDDLAMFLDSTDDSPDTSELEFLLSDSEPEIEPEPEQASAPEDLSQIAEIEAVPDEPVFDIDPELQECFNDEVVEHLENLALQLNSLSSSITAPTPITEEQRKTLHSIRRSVHTMKGAAAVIGIEPVAAWGHDFEDFLDWLHDESPLLSPEIVSIMLDGSDLLEKLADAPSVNVDNEINTIQKHFQTIIDKSNTIQEAPSHPSTIQPSVTQPSITQPSDIKSEPQEPFDEILDEPAFEIDPELQECFDDEVVEHLENLALQLNSLSSSITAPTPITEEQRETLHSIRRSVHTMKGAAAVIGIDPVASWGHDFEDFLDTLYDESNTISPKEITAMQEGADILEKIATHPAIDISTDIDILRAQFQVITDDSSTCDIPAVENDLPQAPKKVATQLPPEPPTPTESTTQADESAATAVTADTDRKAPPSPIEEPVVEQIFNDDVHHEVVTKNTPPIRVTTSGNRRTKVRQSILRVGGDKIAALMGLSGDMAINLSGFENSAFSMQSSLTELEMTLQRLKGIASSLEAGYELASIPHLGAQTGQTEDGIAEEFDPLEMDRYSELHILIRSLNEAVVDLDSIRSQTSDVQSSWLVEVDRQRRIVRNVQGTVQSMQMTPFSTLSNRLHKTVRESAKAMKKQVRLLIEGASIEMDTHIWDVLADALMHMLRNCVDHGVEAAEKRSQANKPEQATIRITCSRVGSRFLLRLSDDGGGLDYTAIKTKALRLFPNIGVEQMNDKELGALIFKQGFSVKSEVTLISGRGVGMDVVRDAIEQLNGFIEVHSKTGQGTEFLLSMPIVVAQLPALMVMFGVQQFAVPMRDISKVFRLSAEKIANDTFEVEKQSFPLLKPTDLLNIEQSTDQDKRDDPSQNTSLALAVVSGGRRGVIVVDAVLGKQNVVFKNLGSHLQSTLCIAGVTILGDGNLVPILQTEDLFTRAETDSLPDAKPERRKIRPKEKPLEILITDDSISIRKVLGNFVTAQGWNPTTAHDGVEAMEKIRDRKPDLILLDIEMPRMNGFEVLQTLRSQSAYRDIPVLMLTSRSAEKYKAKASQLGASGFVTKPFKDDELLALINGLTTHKPAKGKQ